MFANVCLVMMPAVVAVMSLLQTSLAMSDVKVEWGGDNWYNPSLIDLPDSYVSAIKGTEFKRTKGKTWWMNTLYMCEGRKSDNMRKMKCDKFDPWKPTPYKECELDSRVRGGKLDTTGLGDVKVWNWPGKGVYAIFGRKPPRNESSQYCEDMVVYHQWLVLVKPDPAADRSDPWLLKAPLALVAHHQYPEGVPYVMEKNWMPFIYKNTQQGQDHLLVTYMVQPHKVYELHPDGSAVPRWSTHNKALFEKFAMHDVHGGPPVAYVPADLSPSGEAYYLGVMHHIERFDNGRIRVYRHFAFKIQAVPPFAITAVSDELPLVFNTTYKARTAWVAFVNGLSVSKNGTVYISYGSADVNARVLVMNVAELERMFSGEIKFREYEVPYEAVPLTPHNPTSFHNKEHLKALAGSSSGREEGAGGRRRERGLEQEEDVRLQQQQQGSAGGSAWSGAATGSKQQPQQLGSKAAAGQGVKGRANASSSSKSKVVASSAGSSQTARRLML